MYCPRGGTCGADLRTAVNYGLDVAVVHNGCVYEFTRDALNSTMVPPNGYIRLGDLVKEVK